MNRPIAAEFQTPEAIQPLRGKGGRASTRFACTMYMNDLLHCYVVSVLFLSVLYKLLL